MTAYTLAANANLRQIGTAGVWGVATARTGGDTVDTNGFNLTIDQDTRYGLSGTTSTSFGSITINANKGGQLNIDGRYVRMIPFTGGSGTITAGTTITCGSGTGAVIGLYSSLTTAPVLTGVATGWIKVTAWNGVAFPTSGAFTQAGYTFTISGASIVGFIEVVGDEAGTITANRLGSVNITGDWFEVGTTSGSSATTYQLPTNGAIQYYPSLWVETAVGSGVYESYPNSGSLVAAASTPTDAVRGKFCWTTTAGVLRFGSDGTNTVGYLPPVGLKIRLPNILLNNCTTAARTVNVLPNATLATRYDFTCTGGGVVNIDKATCNWYPSFNQAFSVNLSYTGIAEQLLVSEIAQPVVWDNVAVGQTAAQAQIALSMSLCFAGGTITNCNFTRATQATALAVRTLTDISDFVFTGNQWRSRVLRAAANTMMATDTRVADCTFTNEVAMGQINIITCTNIVYTGHIYYDQLIATTATNPLSVWSLSSNCVNIKMDGLSFGGLTNAHPYTSILTISSAGCTNIKLRNIGTMVAPLNLGSANATGLIYVLGGGAAASDVKIQRVYCANTRTGVMTGDNSSTRVIEENVFGDYADAADVAQVLNYTRKGRGGTLAVTAQTAIYGTHWYDCHISTTAGRIGLMMNETTSLTSSQITLTNGAAFTSTGGLYMPTVGMTVTFEIPYYLIGHTAFQNSPAIMAGGTATNYTYGFQIDKNDGAGWSTLTSGSTATTLATALNALTGISALLGFKLRIKITTGTANTTAITSFYLLTSSTTTTQGYQYPLETNTFTLTGLVPNSDIVIKTSDTNTALVNVDQNATETYGFVYTYAPSTYVDIKVIKAGYIPYQVYDYLLGSTDSSLPIAQVADRNYV